MPLLHWLSPSPSLIHWDVEGQVLQCFHSPPLHKLCLLSWLWDNARLLRRGFWDILPRHPQGLLSISWYLVYAMVHHGPLVGQCFHNCRCRQVPRIEIWRATEESKHFIWRATVDISETIGNQGSQQGGGHPICTMVSNVNIDEEESPWNVISDDKWFHSGNSPAHQKYPKIINQPGAFALVLTVHMGDAGTNSKEVVMTCCYMCWESDPNSWA